MYTEPTYTGLMMEAIDNNQHLKQVTMIAEKQDVLLELYKQGNFNIVILNSLWSLLRGCNIFVKTYFGLYFNLIVSILLILIFSIKFKSMYYL